MTAALPERWATRLNTATTPEEIARIAADFLLTWNEADRLQLPAGCRPAMMQSPQDVNEYAFTLAQAQLSFDGPLATGLVLDRMMVFFTAAATRTAHLMHIARVSV